MSQSTEDRAPANAQERIERAHHRVNPPARLVFTDPAHFIAFGFGSGLAPFAPGTVGSAAAIPLFLLLSPLDWPYFLAAVLLLSALGIWVCSESSRRMGVHDHPGIVWDEVVGMLITLAPIAHGFWRDEITGPIWLWIYAGFLTFRAIDVIKPPPIGWLDRNVHGGLGIMLDDIAAGAASALIITLLAMPEVLLGP